MPRRYTIESIKSLTDLWDLTSDAGAYDLWVLGPNGFHRHFTGNVNVPGMLPEIVVGFDAFNGGVFVKLHNTGQASCMFTVTANAYFTNGPWTATVAPLGEIVQRWALASSGNWYDFTVTAQGRPALRAVSRGAWKPRRLRSAIRRWEAKRSATGCKFRSRKASFCSPSDAMNPIRVHTFREAVD